MLCIFKETETNAPLQISLSTFDLAQINSSAEKGKLLRLDKATHLRMYMTTETHRPRVTLITQEFYFAHIDIFSVPLDFILIEILGGKARLISP